MLVDRVELEIDAVVSVPLEADSIIRWHLDHLGGDLLEGETVSGGMWKHHVNVVNENASFWHESEGSLSVGNREGLAASFLVEESTSAVLDPDGERLGEARKGLGQDVLAASGELHRKKQMKMCSNSWLVVNCLFVYSFILYLTLKLVRLLPGSGVRQRWRSGLLRWRSKWRRTPVLCISIFLRCMYWMRRENICLFEIFTSENSWM